MKVRALVTAPIVAKRTFDVIVAGAALIAFAPLIVVVAMAVKLDSPGPVFYRCRRVGFRGCALKVLKFRKMQHGALGPPLTSPYDERFTRIGAVLARTKLDELPQLWNVVKGEMSLVGPRPEDPSFVHLRPAEFREILEVKPGVTGLSQLAFARESEILRIENRLQHYVEHVLPQKLAIDSLYVRKRTFSLDLRILGWTVIAIVLRRDVAVHRDTGRLNRRRRPVPATNLVRSVAPD